MKMDAAMGAFHGAGIGCACRISKNNPRNSIQDSQRARINRPARRRAALDERQKSERFLEHLSRRNSMASKITSRSSRDRLRSARHPYVRWRLQRSNGDLASPMSWFDGRYPNASKITMPDDGATEKDLSEKYFN
jgi:hypothetical protein